MKGNIIANGGTGMKNDTDYGSRTFGIDELSDIIYDSEYDGV